uniref:WAT1-related protein n=1 Tax=Triticum monococcum TaxID=4568 RepID=Q947C6_TRIMO|nr:putative nodulin-like-like protein [Triticum monococcum]
MAAVAMADGGGKKPYVVAVAIQAINTGTFVVSKAAFDSGMYTYIFVFYRLAAATALLVPIALINCACRRSQSTTSTPAQAMSCRLLFKLFLCAFLGSAGLTLQALTKFVKKSCQEVGGFTSLLSSSLLQGKAEHLHPQVYHASLKQTSATVASAATNSMPVVTFLLALVLRMETIKLRRRSGLGKLAGVALCLAGVLVIAFYVGPSIRPLAHHPVFAHKTQSVGNGAWIRGTFLLILSCTTWSLWITLQVPLLIEYPNKLMATAMQCLFSALQSFVVAVVVEKDFTKWKLGLDIGLLAAFLGTGALMYLQAWCAEMSGPVFVVMWSPLAFIFTIFSSSFFLGEVVHLGSILGGILLVGGLYSVLWGKSNERKNMILPVMPEKSQGQGDGDGATTQEKHGETNLTSQV